MRHEPFLHKAGRWNGYYRLTFINHEGETYTVEHCTGYTIHRDAVEYVLDDNSEHYTHDRLIAVVECERY